MTDTETFRAGSLVRFTVDAPYRVDREAEWSAAATGTVGRVVYNDLADGLAPYTAEDAPDGVPFCVEYTDACGTVRRGWFRVDEVASVPA